MSSNDWILLEQWRREGDAEAFGELVSRYAGMVYRTSRRILGNTSDAQDLTQECFAQLAQHPEQPRTHLGAWLHRVATTRSLNRLDGEKRRRQREREYAESLGDSVSSVFSRELQEIVDTAISELPEDLHAVVVEHFLNGKTHETIAEDTGVSRQTITYRTQKGIELIRKSLQRRGVLVPVSALFVALSSGTSEAVPATLAANLGRLALAGPRVLPHGAAAVRSVHWLSRITSAFSWPNLAGTGGAFLLVATLLVAVPYYRNPASDVNAAAKPSRAVSSGEKDTPALLQPASSQSPAGPAKRAPETTTESTNNCTFDFKIYGESGMVPHASILVEHLSWDRWETPPARMETWSAESDSAGLAQLSAMSPGFYLVTATTSTQAGVSWVEAFEAGKTYGTSVWLSPAGTIEGIIVDEQGKPVSDADIGPCHWSETNSAMWRDYALALRTKSDANGRFRLEHIRLGSWKIFVSAIGYAMTLTDFLPTNGPPVTITLGQGGQLRCKVIEATSNEPLAGVTVMFSGPATWDWFPRQTDSKGEIYLPHAALGQHKINVFDQVYFGEGGAKTVKIAAATEPMEVTLKAVRGGQIEGRVYDAETRQGIAGAKVVLEDTARLAEKNRPPSTTDADGRYCIGGGLADCPGTLRVLEAPGYRASAEASAITVAHRADVRILDMDFALHKGRPVSGIVTTASGRPVSGVSITALGDEKGLRQETVSTGDGSFTLEGFERGSLVHVFGQGDGMMSDALGPFPIPEQGIKGLRVALQPESSIAGSVVSSDGSPLASWQVRIARIDKRSVEHDPLLTDAMGQFQMNGLFAGTYAVAVASPRARFNDREASEHIVLKLGEHLSDLRLICDASLSISGHVQGSTRARDGMLVECFGPVTASVYTDDYGDFVITGLMEGAYDMRASGQGCCSSELKDIRAGTSGVLFQMRAMAEATGCVVRGDTQEPITSYEIVHIPGKAERLPSREPLDFRHVQDPQGMFGLDRLEVGDNTIAVRAPGFPVTFFPLTDVPSNGVISGITIALEAGRTLTGVVLDDHRAPVAEASFFLDTLPARESRPANRVGHSDADGRFRIDCVPCESATIVCYKDGYAPAQTVLSAGRDALAPVSMTLGLALQLQGVVTLEGEPVSGQEVRVSPLPRSSGPEQYARTAQDGTFQIDALGPGEVVIEATLHEGWLDPPQVRRLSTNTVLTFPVSDPVVLDFPRGEGLVVGIITDQGEPVSGATILAEFSLPNGIETIESKSLRDGSFLMEFAPVGASTITVIDETSNSHSYEQRTAIKSGEPTQLEIALDQESPTPWRLGTS